MKRILTLAILLSLIGPAIAQVNPNSVPAVLTEESELIITGNNLNSTGNSIKATVITADGQSVELSATANKKGTKASIILPKIPSGIGNIVKLVLRLSGGDIGPASPQEFLTVLLTRPSNFVADLPSSTADVPPTLPSNIDPGTIQPGPTGPQGARGDAGTKGDTGPTGPQGAQHALPVGSSITANTALQATDATQHFIKNIPLLTTAGVTLKRTTFFGPVNGAEGFVGNLNGLLLTPAQPNVATLTGLTKAGTAGSKTTFLGPVNGDQGFVGNLTGNVTGNLTGTVLTATQNSIATMTGLTKAGTSGVRTTLFGPVNGAEGFIGNLTGNSAGVHTGNVVGNVTGNLTGSVLTAAQPNITTMTGLTNAGTTAVTTTFAGPVAAPEGFSGTFNGNINGNLNGLVLVVAQPNITTLAGLTNAGATGVTATFAGPVSASEGFSGNVTGNVSGSAASFTGALAGDVTGTQSATAIVDSVVTGKKLSGVYTAGAGVVANGDSLKSAIQKLDGNIAVNTASIVSVNGNVLASKATLAAATDANTASTLVKRDASGNFSAGTITATFSGNLTGNVTGNADTATNATNAANATTAVSFSGALAGDVTGTQSATAIADSVVSGKKLNGAYVAGAAALPVNGDTLQVAIGKLHGTASATTTSLNAATATLAAATSANTASTLVLRSANGDFAASGIAANTISASTFVGNGAGITNVTGASVTGTVANATSATTATLATKANAVASVTGTGTLTYEGTASNYSTILRATNTTDVTLPTTGTLATTADVATKADAAATAASIAAIATGLTPIAVSGTDVDLGVPVTTFSATGINFKRIIDSNAIAETLTTITGGVEGQRLTLIFGTLVGGAVLVTDDDSGAANNGIDINSTTATFNTRDVLELIYYSGCWHEVSRSVNSN